MSNFPLFLTRLPLYLDVLLVCGRGFPSISFRFFPAGLFFFLHIAIGRSFLPTWQRRNGGGSPCVLLFQAPCSDGISVAVREAQYCLPFLTMRRLPHSLPLFYRLCDRVHPVFPVPTLPVAC